MTSNEEHTMKASTTRAASWTILAMMLTTSISFAASPATQGTATPAEKKTAEKPDPSAKKIWDYWYTATVAPKMHYAYYHEVAEVKQGRIHFQSTIWKNEEGFINEEQLGSFSEDNGKFTPLFFNFHGNYRASETAIDATIKDGKLQAKVSLNLEDQPLVNRMVPSNAIFSSVFPLWMQAQLKNLPAEKAKNFTLPFLAILEDHADNGFTPEDGRFRVVDADEYSKKSGSIRVEVDFNNQKSHWYLDKDGAPIRISIASQNTVVDRVTEKQAKSFFKSKP